MQYCYGTTTIDASGLTLGQLQQLLGVLALPALPPLTPAQGAAQNATEQASSQSQTGEGQTVDPSAGENQVAAQSNTTVQVALGAIGDGAGPAAVNQTSQGIWQLQIGCLFDCTGTLQLQQATQSNTTVQAVGGSAADNTVTQLVWQLQIGCLFWCYDAVAGQTAAGTDLTVVITPGPVPGPAPSSTPAPTPSVEGAPATGAPSDTVAPPVTAGPSVTTAPPVTIASPVTGDPPVEPPVGAPVLAAPEALKPAAGVVGPGRVHLDLRGIAVTGGSESVVIGRGEAVTSVSETRSVALEFSLSTTHVAHHREPRSRAGHRARHAARTDPGISRRAAVKPPALAPPWMVVVLAVAAALALAAGLRRRFGA